MTKPTRESLRLELDRAREKLAVAIDADNAITARIEECNARQIKALDKGDKAEAERCAQERDVLSGEHRITARRVKELEAPEQAAWLAWEKTLTFAERKAEFDTFQKWYADRARGGVGKPN